jgi:hypothetical protein
MDRWPPFKTDCQTNYDFSSTPSSYDFTDFLFYGFQERYNNSLTTTSAFHPKDFLLLQKRQRRDWPGDCSEGEEERGREGRGRGKGEGGEREQFPRRKKKSEVITHNEFSFPSPTSTLLSPPHPSPSPSPSLPLPLPLPSWLYLAAPWPEDAQAPWDSM